MLVLLCMRPALLGSCLPRCGFLGRLADDFPDAGLKELWSLKSGLDAHCRCSFFGFLALVVVFSWVVSRLVLEGGK